MKIDIAAVRMIEMPILRSKCFICLVFLRGLRDLCGESLLLAVRFALDLIGGFLCLYIVPAPQPMAVIWPERVRSGVPRA
jgi:hypothetical protein